MKDLVYAIQDFFMIVLAPLADLAELELKDWFAANTINWLFIVIGFAAMLYWLKQLKIFNDEGTEKRDVVSHSFFK
jgi:hypothetical protein|tara:strand:+ start:1099 stop:1326 length:228 start_codon:yes stop_codon:yes gene_type:complete